MKKILSFLAITAAIFMFTACPDVELPDSPQNGEKVYEYAGTNNYIQYYEDVSADPESDWASYNAIRYQKCYNTNTWNIIYIYRNIGRDGNPFYEWIYYYCRRSGSFADNYYNKVNNSLLDGKCDDNPYPSGIWSRVSSENDGSDYYVYRLYSRISEEAFKKYKDNAGSFNIYIYNQYTEEGQDFQIPGEFCAAIRKYLR